MIYSSETQAPAILREKDNTLVGTVVLYVRLRMINDILNCNDIIYRDETVQGAK